MILKTIAELNETTLSAAFSIKLKTFSASAQKAVWASAIIREILKAKPTSAFDSLQRRVKNLKLPTSIQNADEDIEKEMKVPFINGIKLDNYFLNNQSRLTHPNDQQNFIFCPNYTVTQPMFEHLFSIEKNLFVNGQFGTSKTISVILGNILSRPINNFKVDAHKDRQKLEELKILNKESLLFYTPKFFYWSIPSTISSQKQLISQKILVKQLKEQLTDLPPTQFQEISKMNEILDVRSAIIDFYWNRAGIYTKVVIDQINTAASVIREWNSQISIDQHKKKNLKEQIENQTHSMIKSLKQPDYLKRNKIKEMYELRLKILQQELTSIEHKLELTMQKNKDQKEIANNMIDMVNTYRTFGHFLLFNSSVNVEEQILRFSRRRNRPLLGLQILGQHFAVQRQHIHYFKALKKQQGRRDFFNFFWFEIERRIKHKPAQQVLDDFEAKFYEIAKDIPIRHYSRPYFIYLFIQQEFKDIEQSLLPLIQQLDEQKAKRYLKKLLEDYNTYCLQQSKVKINQFVTNEKRRELISIINEFARSLLDQKKQQIVIPIEVFDKNFEVSLQGLLLSNNHNKELIPLEYDAAKKEITFHWSPQQFIEISKDITDQFKLYQSLMDNYNKTYFQRYPPSEGYYFQYTLVELLKPTVSFSLSTLASKPQGTTPKSSPIYKKKSYVIFSVKEFISFKKEEENKKEDDDSKNRPKQKNNIKQDDKKKQDKNLDSISENFSQMLIESSSNPSKTIMGIPFCNKDKYDYRNPTFDFVLMTYNKKKDLYKINTFDATISRSSLGTKEPDARKFLAKLCKDKKGLNFEIHHTILCSSEQCNKKWKESQDKAKERQSKYSEDQFNLVVKYSSYDGFELKYCPVTESFARMKFLGFRRFVQKNDKSKSTQEPQQKPTQTN